MVALQIRDVPADVRDRLADRARAEGQSMQTYLLRLVTDEAERASNLDVLKRFSARADGTTAESAARALREAREEREAGLSDDA